MGCGKPWGTDISWRSRFSNLIQGDKMKKSIRWITVFAVISTVFLFTAQVSASPTTTGFWTAYPGQSVSTSTSTSTHTVYQATVRPPINLDGSSNWPKKRGVIPVQFDLLSATATDTITTTVTGPFIFESILSDSNPDNDISYVSFTPGSAMTFGDIWNLSAVYDFTAGDCYGGSLRWQVRIDVQDDSDPGNNPAIFIYYGSPPQFGNGGDGGCDDANNQNNLNLIGQLDLRYDLSQLGGPWYGSYSDATSYAGTHVVSRVSLMLDSGWVADQVVDFTSATVNDNTFTPLPEGTTSTTTTTVGSFSPTCDLPAAKLQWSKTDPYPDGSINEGESIQPRDTGEFYRIVDCKYIYNLDVSSLDPNLATRGGTYFVYVEIDGTLINNPAKFDLK
jgi:hypothetical protein